LLVWRSLAHDAPREAVDVDQRAAMDAPGDDFNENLDPILPNNDNDS
jgi:hypothetical protein